MAETKYSEMFSAEQLRAELDRVQGRKLFGRKKKKKKQEHIELPGHDELPKITVENGRIAFAEAPPENDPIKKRGSENSKTASSETVYKAFDRKSDEVFNEPSGDAHGIGRGIFVTADDILRLSSANVSVSSDAFQKPERIK